MEYQQFIEVLAYLDPNYGEEDDGIIPNNRQFVKRIVAVPLDHIYYIQEGFEKGTTDIVLADGDVITALANYRVIFEIWRDWYHKKENTFVSFHTRNN